jgi:Probable cobalt transporter subunit (CbtB)
MMLAQVLTREGARTWRLTAVAALAALGLYVLAVDQGLALSLLQGDLAFDQNLIHELLHDGRHALGVPCH